MIWKLGDSAGRTAELRLPKKTGGARVIVIDLNTESACANHDQMVGKYGEPAELAAPTASQPPGSPTYYVYGQPWGDFRLGVDARDCVVSVVLNVERQER